MSDIDDAIDELYGLPVEEFTAARNALAARLKKEGDKARSDEVKRLGKPTVSAWVMNRLFRDRGAELDALVEAGEEVREAQAGALRGGGGDELRDASRAQREAQSRLMRAAAQILEAGGHAASAATLDKVGISLQALAAAGWGDAQPGRLAGDLEPPGFDAIAGLLASTPAKSPRAASPGRAAKAGKGDSAEVEVSYEGDELASAATEQARARRAEAEAALEQAKKRAKKLARDAEDAQTAQGRAEERARTLRDDAAEARRRAEEAQDRAVAAEEKAKAAAEAARTAKRSAVEAEREVAAAEEELKQ